MFSNLDQFFVAAKSQILAVLGDWLPAPIVSVISALVNIAGVLAVFLTLFALISVMERKILARIQNRYGPNRVGPCGLLQPVADGIKMLIKEDLVPRGADKVIHFIAPIAMVAPTILALCLIPYGRNMAAVDLDAGLLLFFAVGSATELAVFMAGWGSNNKYSVLGAMRAIAQMISYELPLIVCAIPVVLVTGTLSLPAIVEAQGGYTFGTIPHWFVTTPWGFVGFILFYIAALVETNRTPFDLPEGESEIIAGHMTEYSGFKYAIFFMAEYFGMFAVSGLAVTLFLGGWQAPCAWLTWIPSYMWFFGKLCVLLFVFIWIRGTLPRVRVDQTMNLAWKFVLPMVFACFFAAAIWHFAGRGWLGWLLSGAFIAAAFVGVNLLFDTGRRFAPRVYRYAE